MVPSKPRSDVGVWGSPRKCSGQAGHWFFVCHVFFRELCKVQTTKVSATSCGKLCRESSNALQQTVALFPKQG